MRTKRLLLHQRGSTIIYIIIALVVFGALAAASVSMYSSSQQTAARPNCAAQARLLAESGLRYAAAELRALTDLTTVNARIAELTGSQQTNTLSDGSSFTYTAIPAPYQVGGTGPYYVNITCRGDACPNSDQSQTSLTATYALSISAGGTLGFEDDLENFNVVGEGSTGGPAGEDGNPAVTVNLDDRTIDLGGNAKEVFGCIWYGGNLDTCSDGNCTLGSGFRAYFEFELSPGSQADGFTFTVMSTETNLPTACGGSVGVNIGELLGYAGTGVSGVGIQPPKMALEFDIYKNSGSGAPCASNSRKDGSIRDHIAAIYWGREENSGRCDGSFDDNRHGEGLLTDQEPRNPGDWSASGAGYDGYFYNNDSWLREWNNSTPNRHKRFLVRIEMDRALEPNESGFYCYNLKGWVKRDNEVLPEGFIDLTKDYAVPDNAATLPDVTDSFVLNAARHADMEHVTFGWTAATGGATMNVTLAEFELDFKPEPEACAVREAPQDYVSYWSMYEGTGDVLHDLNATQNNDGTISDSFWVAGVGCPSCSGLLVDNKNEGQAHIPADWSLVLGNRGTVSAWVYLNAYQNYGGIVHHGDSSRSIQAHGDTAFIDETYTLQFTQDNARINGLRVDNGERKPMICTVKDGPGWQPTLTCAISSQELALQQWYHVVGTWDTAAAGNEMRLYINGVERGTRADCGGARNNFVGLHIGSQVDSGGYPIDGVIDEVYIYDRMLSSAEVLALYRDGLEQP